MNTTAFLEIVVENVGPLSEDPPRRYIQILLVVVGYIVVHSASHVVHFYMAIVLMAEASWSVVGIAWVTIGLYCTRFLWYRQKLSVVLLLAIVCHTAHRKYRSGLPWLPRAFTNKEFAKVESDVINIMMKHSLESLCKACSGILFLVFFPFYF